MANRVQIPDAILVKNYQNGDESALAILINRYQNKVYTFIRSKVNDTELCDDIFQEAFIKIIRKLKTDVYKEEGKFLSWVIRITHNQIVDYYRKNSKVKLIREDETNSLFSRIKDTPSKINHEIQKEIFENEIIKLIDFLPIDQKEIIELRFFKDLSFKEIAELKSISINTALGRVRYGLINLKKMVEKNELKFENFTQ